MLLTLFPRAGNLSGEMNDPRKWTIEYDNDTGRGDESFFEWWTVTDGERSFKCTNNADARWLYRILTSEKGEND